MKKRILATLIFIVALSFPVLSNQPVYFQKGEYLLYEVSFFGIKLGTIEMIHEDSEKIGEQLTFHARTLIKSYPGIPFVDLDVTFDTWMDPAITHTHQFISNKKIDKDTWDYEKFNFQQGKHFIYMKWTNRTLTDSTIVQSSSKFADGTTLFNFARRYSAMKRTVKVPTLISLDTGYTTINFRNKIEGTKIEAISYPVRTRYIDGFADWEGIYGLKGAFEGWFADDETGIPILAKLNLYVGNVNLELKKWKRKGWTPPRFDK